MKQSALLRSHMTANFCEYLDGFVLREDDVALEPLPNILLHEGYQGRVEGIAVAVRKVVTRSGYISAERRKPDKEASVPRAQQLGGPNERGSSNNASCDHLGHTLSRRKLAS